MKTLFAAFLLIPAIALAQTPPQTAPEKPTTPAQATPVAPAVAPIKITLDARGEDIREVLATLFSEAKKPYALDAAIKGKMYVKLDSLPYEKALSIVLTQAGLVAKTRDGVVMISLAPAAPATAPAKVGDSKSTTAAKPVTKATDPKTAEPKMADTKPVEITVATYGHKVTTRLTKAALADVFAAFGDQAEVTIELDPTVPAYRIDAFFVKTSLKYALNRVCKAAGLKYAAVDGKIVVSKD